MTATSLDLSQIRTDALSSAATFRALILPAQAGNIGKYLVTNGTDVYWATGSGGGSSTWGSISGTLSNQTDLQNALNAKANLAGATFTGAISTPSISLGTALAIANGGTGLTTVPTSGQLLIGNGTGYSVANLIAGDGIIVNNSAGSISIAAGTVPASRSLTATITNAEIFPIIRGQVVYAFGAAGDRMSVKLASNTSDATSAKTVGIVSDASIAGGSSGTITLFGTVSNLDLSAFNVGDSVYLGATSGQFTNVKPYAPNHLVYVGTVERANAGNGLLYVRIQNGYELDEIHDVQIVGSPGAGSLLIRDATNSLWKAATLTGGTGITITSGDASSTVGLSNTTVSSGSYGSASQVGTFNVNAQGQLTLASNVAIAIANTQVSGLGTLSTQNANSVSITGGSISGITDLAIADGGTGASTAVTARSNLLPSYSGNATKVLAVNGSSSDVEWITVSGGGGGSITSVALSAPTGFVVSGSPITTFGTLTLNFDTGYALPTTASQSNWDMAFTDRMKWDGGSTGLTASTGRTSLGATTLGSNLFTITNPSAVTFPRFNADNTVSSLDASSFRTATGATTIGANLYTLPNPSATTFPRFNSNNTVSALDAASFRTAIGAGSGDGTVTAVSGTNPIQSSGGTTPAISLASNYGDVQNPYGSKTANYFLAAPNGSAGSASFRAIVAADIPTLNQNTTGSAGSVTNSVTFNNSGTGGASGTAFNGSAATTISYNSVGASPLAGSSSITTVGTITSGTWQGTAISNTYLANSSLTLGSTAVSLGGTASSISGLTSITLTQDPTSDLQVATKQYVDAVSQGLHTHASCMVATTGTLASITGGSVTYNNGSSGVGATLTLGVALTVLDGYTIQNGDRILVKNETAQANNGIYTWATGGTVLTRATDFDSSIEIDSGDFTFVTNGTLYASTGWVQTNQVTTVGTTAVNFSQFSGSGTYTAGTGLTLTGTQFSLTSPVALSNGGTGSTTVTGARTNLLPSYTGNASKVLAINSGGTDIEWVTMTGGGGGSGTVTSVSLTVPTGLSVTGSPVTTSGTLAIAYSAGYAIPTTASQTNWDTAYTDRLKWDGGSSGLTASTGRASLGATTIGENLFTLTNPSAIRFPRFNADNTVSSLDATTFRTAIGAGTGDGTVTNVTGTSPVASSGGATPAISLSSGYGDTQNPYASKTANYVLAAPNGSTGAPTFRALVANDIPTLNQNTTGTSANVTGIVAIANGGTGQSSQQSAINALAGATTSAQYLRGNGTNVVMSAIQAGDVPTLNQSTTGSAASLSISGQTGLLTFTGLTTLNRAKTVRDAADTVLELGGSYTPTGTWNWTSATVTWPTFNQNTTGSAASLSISGQTGLLTFTGLTTVNRAKTVRDAADTILELGGSYTPSGTWNWTTASVTWPTFNQNTTGTASNVTGTVAIANGGTGQTTATAAINALLPSQSTNSGKYLTTDGTNTSWATVSASAAWGSITGTLSNQTDLQSALNAKASLTGATFTGAVALSTGTITSNVGLSLSGTWNNASTIFEALTIDFVDTASNVDSLFLQFLSNTITKYEITKQGWQSTYNTFTSSSSYERARIFWATNQFVIGTEKGSIGGAARPMSLRIDGSDRFLMSATGLNVIYNGVALPYSSLTYGATMAIDCSVSLKYQVTLNGNGTISNPTNVSDGYILVFRLRQDGTGGRVPVWDTNYNFAGDLASVTLSTAANAVDRIAFEYDATALKWNCISFIRGT